MQKILFGVAAAVSQVEALKILMAGDRDHNKSFFYQVARNIADNGQGNEIHMLCPCLPVGETERIDDNFVKYGMGKEHEFAYDPKMSEEENYFALDKAQLKAYWSDEMLLGKLAEENFDLGIGGLLFADSVLFRQLNLNYIKLSEEDVETYAMHVKLNMPVLTSMYHSADIANLFDYYKTPEYHTLSYRWPYFKNYQFEKLKRYNHMKDFKAILKPAYHHLIDDYDQDHAMVLA